MLVTVGNELKKLLENLKDYDGKTVFNRVSLGFQPDLDNITNDKYAFCYVTGINEYQHHVGGTINKPAVVESIMGFTIRGSSQDRYNKLVETYSLMTDKFQSNKDWYTLNHHTVFTKIYRSSIEDVYDNDLVTACIFQLRHFLVKEDEILINNN